MSGLGPPSVSQEGSPGDQAGSTGVFKGRPPHPRGVAAHRAGPGPSAKQGRRSPRVGPRRRAPWPAAAARVESNRRRRRRREALGPSYTAFDTNARSNPTENHANYLGNSAADSFGTRAPLFSPFPSAPIAPPPPGPGRALGVGTTRRRAGSRPARARAGVVERRARRAGGWLAAAGPGASRRVGWGGRCSGGGGFGDNGTAAARLGAAGAGSDGLGGPAAPLPLMALLPRPDASPPLGAPGGPGRRGEWRDGGGSNRRGTLQCGGCGWTSLGAGGWGSP